MRAEGSEFFENERKRMEEKERPFAVRAEASERARLGDSSERATTSVQVFDVGHATIGGVFCGNF